jgi:hypothetical protein
MKRWNLWVFGMIAGCVLIPTEATCEGYGFYGWGRGWPKIGLPGFLEDQVPAFKGVSADLRHDHFTIGYMYDGASTEEDRFGWRFNVGLDIVVTSLQGANVPSQIGLGLQDLSSNLYDAVGYGFATKLAYGYGIVRTPKMRVWVGPSVRLNANYIDQGTTSIKEGSFQIELDPWGVMLSLGGGVEGGIRYAVGPELSVDFSTGFHYNFFGYYQEANLTVNSQSPGSDSSFFTGEEPFVFIQLALRFRFGDGEESR